MVLYHFVGLNKCTAVRTCILIWCLNVANGVTITTKSNNKTVLNGNTLELKWTVNVPGDFIVSLSVYLSPDFINPILVDRSVIEKGRELFENRLSATYGNSTYTMALMDVKYNESGTFRLLVLFRNNGLKETQSDIHVSVTGSPSFCGKNWKSHLNANESKALTIVQKICGYPKPELKWKVDEDSFITASTPSGINNATRQYRYSFKTRPITRKDCGRNLTLVTSNAIGSMERNAKIDVEFVPSLVPDVSSFRHNASCVRVTWIAEDTGICNISYHLQFTGIETIYNTSNTYFTLCNATDVEKVTISASYNGHEGEKLTYIISTITTTTTTATTTKTTTTTSNTTSDCQSTSNLIIAVVVTLVITLISITIIFIISKHRGYIIISISRKKQPQDYENRNTGDYEDAGTTIPHYADINSKAVKPSIYADLTTTADHSKQYAEIELNKMENNTYANMKN